MTPEDAKDFSKYLNDTQETPMTSNERLLKAASATTGFYNSLPGEAISPVWARLFKELEAAVRACEAAEVSPDRETATSMPNVWIDYNGKRYYGGDVVSASPIASLTDQQRRLGLRDLRHVTPGDGNWDYD